MSRTPARAVVLLFDIDGTLLLSGSAGKQALNRAFLRLHGVDDAFAGIRPHGMTDPAIFRQMFQSALERDPTPEDLARLASAYLDDLPAALDQASAFRLMPGIPSLLERLAGMAQVHLGLATGNLEPASRLKLRRGGLDTFFAFGGFGSDAEDRGRLTREAARRGRARAGDPQAPVVVIGDTVRDVQAACFAGARCVAVRTTGADPAALRAAGADLILDDLSEPEPFLVFVEAAGRDV